MNICRRRTRHDEDKVVVGAFQFGQIPADREHVAIAMVHHPLTWLRDGGEVGPWMGRAHITLTGHEHEFGIKPDAAQRRVIIESGAVNPGRTKSGWIPAYNVLELGLSDSDENLLAVKVHVRCWQAKEGGIAGFGPDPRFEDPFPITICVQPSPTAEAEATEAQPPPPIEITPESIESDDRARVFRIMRASPDARQRVAMTLGLIEHGEVGGLSLDRRILTEAQRQGKLKELDEGIRND